MNRRSALAGLAALTVSNGCGPTEAAKGGGHDQAFAVRPGFKVPPGWVGALVDNFTENALSPDGRYFAGNMFVPGQHDNLAVIDLKTRTGWFLKADKPGFLCQPAFSPDGRSLAMIWTSPPYWLRSQVWITGLHGGPARVYAEEGRTFQYPSFSPDSRRLLTFRDGYATPTPITAHVSIPLDNRLYEIDLAVGRGRFLGDTHFVAPYRAAYDPAGRGIFLQVAQELGPNPDYPNTPDLTVVRWTSPQGDDTAMNWLWREGESLPPDTPPYAPPSVVGRAAFFQGVTRSGQILLMAQPTKPPSLNPISVILELYDGHSARVLLDLPAAINDMAGAVISYDGSIAVTGGIKLGKPGQFAEDPALKVIRVIGVQSGQVEKFLLSSVHFTAVQEVQTGG